MAGVFRLFRRAAGSHLRPAHGLRTIDVTEDDTDLPAARRARPRDAPGSDATVRPPRARCAPRGASSRPPRPVSVASRDGQRGRQWGSELLVHLTALWCLRRLMTGRRSCRTSHEQPSRRSKSWAFPDVARALLGVSRTRWQHLRPTLEAVQVKGSGGRDASFGAILRERTPTPRWAEPTPVDELLPLVEAVEVKDFLERMAPPPLCHCHDARRIGCRRHGPWPFTPSARGRPYQTTRWLAVSEVQRRVRQRHRGLNGRLDGAASWRLVVEILEHLGWDFRDLATSGNTDDMGRLLKQGLRRWRRTCPPAAIPEGVRTRRLGGLLLLDPAPAGATPAA
jgi:hypothetical protein